VSDRPATLLDVATAGTIIRRTTLFAGCAAKPVHYEIIGNVPDHPPLIRARNLRTNVMWTLRRIELVDGYAAAGCRYECTVVDTVLSDADVAALLGKEAT
jgi:hypothetical protein